MHISDIIANVADLHLFLDLLRVECYPFILSGQKADERVPELANRTISIFLSLSYVVISGFQAFELCGEQRVCCHAWDESKCIDQEEYLSLVLCIFVEDTRWIKPCDFSKLGILNSRTF